MSRFWSRGQMGWIAAVLIACGFGTALHHFVTAQTPPIHPRLFLSERSHVIGLSTLFSDATFQRLAKDQARLGVGRGRFLVGDRYFQGTILFGANGSSAPASAPNPVAANPLRNPTPDGLSFSLPTGPGTVRSWSGTSHPGSDSNLVIADPRSIDFLPVALDAALNTLSAEFSQGYSVHQVVTFRRASAAGIHCVVLCQLSSATDSRYVMISALDLRRSFGPLRIVTGG